MVFACVCVFVCVCEDNYHSLTKDVGDHCESDHR